MWNGFQTKFVDYSFIVKTKKPCVNLKIYINVIKNIINVPIVFDTQGKDAFTILLKRPLKSKFMSDLLNGIREINI